MVDNMLLSCTFQLIIQRTLHFAGWNRYTWWCHDFANTYHQPEAVPRSVRFSIDLLSIIILNIWTQLLSLRDWNSLSQSFMLLRPIKVWFCHALYFVCVSYYFREAGQGRCHEGNLFWIWGDHWPTCLFKWRYCVKLVVWNWQLFLSYLFCNRNVNIGARFGLSSRMNSLELQVFKLLVALQVWRQMNVWWTMEDAGKTQV